jgi:hypothetical protein
MSPSILEMAKKDITRLRIETAFTIGLSLPKICKPSIPRVKIKPTLHKRRIYILRITHKELFKVQNLLMLATSGKDRKTILYFSSPAVNRMHSSWCLFPPTIEPINAPVWNMNGLWTSWIDQKKYPSGKQKYNKDRTCTLVMHVNMPWMLKGNKRKFSWTNIIHTKATVV